MISKLILVGLLLASSALAGRRRLRCLIKSDSTKTSSNLLHTYTYTTHAGSCGRASGRVHSRCTGAFPKLTREFITKYICGKVEGRIPDNGQGLKVPIYLTGKADCKSNADTNAWMDPLKKAEVCCAAYLNLGPVGCQKGVDKWCSC